MKKTLFLLLLPVLAFAQKNEVRTAGEAFKIDVDRTYLIKRDTSESGVITITMLPTDQLAKELESQIGGYQGELVRLDEERAKLDEQQQNLNIQIKEILVLIENIKNGGGKIGQPAVKEQPPNTPTKPVAKKPPAKKKKQ